MPLITGYSSGSGEMKVIPPLPEQIDNFRVTAGNLSVTLSWTSPVKDENNSYAGVRIVRKVDSCPANHNDGTVVYEGKGTSYTDEGLIGDTTYYYRAFSYNSEGKYQTSMRYEEVTVSEELGLSISKLAVGSLVNLKVNGTSKQFIVVNQGIPSNSNLYDSSCNGTWLLMKDAYTNRTMDSSDNDYANSDIHVYLNGEFFSLLGENVRTAIKEVKIPYRNGNGSKGNNQSGSRGLSAKVFLLSDNEVGVGSFTSEFPKIGSLLSYFIDGDTTAANTARTAYYNGSIAYWYLRSPYTSNTTDYILIDGNDGTGVTNTSRHIRPAFILSDDVYVSPEPDATGAYTLISDTGDSGSGGEGSGGGTDTQYDVTVVQDGMNFFGYSWFGSVVVDGTTLTSAGTYKAAANSTLKITVTSDYLSLSDGGGWYVELNGTVVKYNNRQAGTYSHTITSDTTLTIYQESASTTAFEITTP